MNDERTGPSNLIDTTDCLEAVDEFRWWKNVFFIIVFLSLILSQACFWLVDRGLVSSDESTGSPAVQTLQGPVVSAALEGKAAETQAAEAPATKFAAETAPPLAASDAAEGPNQPAEAPAQQPPQKGGFALRLTIRHMGWIIRFLNFILIPAGVLYCLTILFALKVSLLGRLGGISHIARAFFLSLFFVVILLPWQNIFGNVTVGIIYTCRELLSCCAAADAGGTAVKILHYLKFTVYWMAAMLILILAQFRTARWTKAVLRRLEIMV